MPQLPEKIARQYAALVLEKRKGEIALIPSAVFAPTGNPTDAQLTAWYNDNRTQFIRPERRTLRFAVFGEGLLPVALEMVDRSLLEALEESDREERIRNL